VATERKEIGSAGAGATLPGKNAKPFDLIRFVFLRSMYVVLFGSVLFLPLLPLVVAKMYRLYEVSGRIQFDREPLSAMGAAPSQSIAYYFQDYVRSQTKLVKEHGFIKEVLAGIPAAQWPGVLRAHTNALDTATARLSGLLEVNFDNGTQFITLRMESLERDGLDSLMNRMMDAFVDRKISEQFASIERNMKYVAEQRETVQKRIDQLRGTLDAVAEESGTSLFVEDNNLWRSAYQQTQAQLAQAEIERVLKQSRLVAESNRVAQIKALPVQALADELTAADQSLWGVTLWTYQTLQDLRKSVDGVAAGNPDRRYVDERMKSIDTFAKTFRSEIEVRNLRIIEDKRDYDLVRSLVSAQADAAAAASAEWDVRLLADKTKSNLVETSRALWRGRLAEQTMERLSTQLDVYENRLRVLEAERAASARVSVAAYAVLPENGVLKFPKKTLIILVMFTYGVVVFIYGAYDFLDNRVRSQRDMEAALGAEAVRPVWLVPPPVRYAGIITTLPLHPVSGVLRSLAYKLEREHRVNSTFFF